MSQFIENPRKSPRAPVRCEARVALRDGGYWAGPTTDYGPRGCQLLAPVRYEPGGRIYLELVNDRVPGEHHLTGRIAWASNAAPWRIGVAFDEGSVVVARDFFDRLAAAYPGLDTYGRAPDRLPLDAPLAPAPPPHVAPELVAGEEHVLRVVGAGTTAAALREQLAAEWPGSVNLVFALLGRHYLRIGPPDPAAADAWTPLLAHHR